ncbi:DUF6233 domain-containing protein [Streptomyces liangshanensis]|uniref:DUF6233 domain-containing protein n=1 Tax=Streptomyces liangshanensis TaxID=2717324 RepID=UPI0036DE8F00
MPEHLSRLDLYLFLEEVQVRDLARTRQWITAERKRIASARPVRPTVEGPQEQPDWVIEFTTGAREPVAVHVAGCTEAPTSARVIKREQAVAALVEHGVQPCPQCRPDTALGVLA